MQPREKYITFCHFNPTSLNLRGKYAANAPNQDASLNTANASEKVKFAGQNVNASIAKIISRYNISKNQKLNEVANVLNLSAWKIIVNAFKKDKPVMKNAVV